MPGNDPDFIVGDDDEEIEANQVVEDDDDALTQDAETEDADEDVEYNPDEMGVSLPKH